MKEPKEMALLAAKALSDKKGREIQVLEIGELTTLADYFVIATGSSNTQINALVDNVEKVMLEEAGEQPLHREGYRGGTWVLLDYGCIAVHVFNAGPVSSTAWSACGGRQARGCLRRGNAQRIKRIRKRKPKANAFDFLYNPLARSAARVHNTGPTAPLWSMPAAAAGPHGPAGGRADYANRPPTVGMAGSRRNGADILLKLLHRLTLVPSTRNRPG